MKIDAHMHVGFKYYSAKDIIEYLDNTGVLDEKTLLVHSIWIDDKDIEIPFPHLTLYLGQDKDGSAAPLHLKKETEKGKP